MELSAWKALGQIEQIDGYEMFTVDHGNPDRPVVLMIHGFPTASWDWHAVWTRLAGDFRLITLDLLGYGLSAKPPRHRYSFAEQADLVETLMARRGFDAVHILAHDYGDTVAQELLARQNERGGEGIWKSCCLLNGGLFAGQHRPLLIQHILASRLGPLVGPLLSKARLRRSMHRIAGPQRAPTENEIDTFWALISANKGRAAIPLLSRYMHERVRHRERFFGALKHATVPLALINGSADPISGAHLVAWYRQAVGEPAFTLELADAGHYPQLEYPDAVVDGFRSFIGRVDDEQA
ncbi:MAG: alpha/beta hydrolase [Pseudomonadota bacterium]